MHSSRPYLIRAFFEWIIDNELTPYLVVDATLKGVTVPKAYVEDGRIILNISPGAIKNLLIANDHLEFNARFAGVAQEVYTPIQAITAIYAKENGRGMVFKDEDDEDDEDDDHDDHDDDHHDMETDGKHSSGKSGKSGKAGKNGKPTLTIVK